MQPPLQGNFELVGDAQDGARRQFSNHEAYVEGEQSLTFAMVECCRQPGRGIGGSGSAARGCGGDRAPIVHRLRDRLRRRRKAGRGGQRAQHPSRPHRRSAAIFDRSSPALAIVDESLGIGRPARPGCGDATHRRRWRRRCRPGARAPLGTARTVTRRSSSGPAVPPARPRGPGLTTAISRRRFERPAS